MNQEETAGYEGLITRTLERALDEAPFYRTLSAQVPGASAPIAQRYQALPRLTKREIRAHMPRGFVARSRDLPAGLASGEVELVATSGTTEERSSILWHQPWWDASEHAAARLHTGLDNVITGNQREAVLTTPLCAGTTCHIGDLPIEERTLGRLLFLNQQPDPARWRAGDMDRMISELADFQPELLEADPAYLAMLCRYAADHGRPLFQPRYISLTFEFPSRLHYREIRRSYPDLPILSSYGSTETGHLLTECEQGRFHQNTEYCHLEVEPLAPFHGQPGTGRLLVSLLRHPWVHLLRFDIGDLVRIAPQPCPCGRGAGLTMERILGRVRDTTFTTGGRAVSVDELDRTVAPHASFLQYQLEQREAGEYILHYVADAEPGASEAALAEALETLYGPDARVSLRRESAIPAEASGKFRLGRTRFTWDPDTLFTQKGPRP